MANRITLDVVRLGAQADGIAETNDGFVYVPGALPGERVVADVEGERGTLIAVETSAADRVTAPCSHFGKCGGCQIQHIAEGAYLEWKRGLVVAALRARGIDADVRDAVAFSGGVRRRATFTVAKSPSGVRLGFREAMSHALVDLKECPVLDGAIVEALPRLRDLAARVMKQNGELRVYVLRAGNGLDVDFSGDLSALSPAELAELSKRAQAFGLVRLSLQKDPVFQAAEPVIRCGIAEVVPPPGSFLQASREAEEYMADLVAAAAGKKARRVADLFCGVGAFTFSLAKRAKVTAFDSDADAVSALRNGANRTQGLRGIGTVIRDLFSEPLSRRELADFDCVVCDPPRAGARAQAEMLAKSKVPTVIAVSCNPATLARDLRILIDGGYQLGTVTPIDQFQYSHHVETVAVLRR